MNKRYVVTIEIRDGDYEYFSKSQHQLDPEEMDKAEDRDAYILKDVFGNSHFETEWGRWYETDPDDSYDYRLYRIYSLVEVESTEHAKLLRHYGIY